MIETMRRVTFIYQKYLEDEILSSLQKAGLVHFNYDAQIRGLRVTQLEHYLEVLDAHLKEIPKESFLGLRQTDKKEDHAFIKELKAVKEAISKTEQRLEKLILEKERVLPFGNFCNKTLKELKREGLYVHIYKVGVKQQQELAGLDWFLLFERKGFFYVAVISEQRSLELPFKRIALPSSNAQELDNEIAIETQKVSMLKDLVEEMQSDPSPLLHLSQDVKNLMEFERTKGLRQEAHEELAYLTGYAPLSQMQTLKELSKQVPFVIFSESVQDANEAPTKFHHNGWSRLFVPILKFIGVVPGYGEKDINGFFLLFFSIFFAMLIGDAGYGLIFLLVTGYLHFKKKEAWPKDIFTLFYFLSSGTLIWGTVTGMWFGHEPLVSGSPLKYLVVPELNSFSKESEPLVMRICFILGFSQLAFAHLWQMMIQPRWTQKLTEIGWIGFLFGFYLLAEYFLIQTPLPEFTVNLFIFSSVVLVLFSEQRGQNFFKGILTGLAQFPMNLLNAVGIFSDVVSYIRLFALGLATKEMAGAANSLALGTGWDTSVGIALGILVLLIGHLINIVLAAIAVMVHAIRLNFLEFAKHLEMQWTGRPYKPFAMAERNAS